MHCIYYLGNLILKQTHIHFIAANLYISHTHIYIYISCIKVLNPSCPAIRIDAFGRCHDCNSGCGVARFNAAHCLLLEPYSTHSSAPLVVGSVEFIVAMCHGVTAWHR